MKQPVALLVVCVSSARRSISVIACVATAAACGPGYDPSSEGDGGRVLGDSGEPFGSGGEASGGQAGATTTGGADDGAGGADVKREAGSAGAGGSGPAAGGAQVDAGTGGMPEPPPPPSVTSVSPVQGAFGTEVTVSGAGLGSAHRPNVFLIVGEDTVVLTPENDAVMSWTETEITFRVPFPAEGTISIETPQGSVVAGEFTATWISAWTAPIAPGAALIASVSARSNHIALLFDTSPAILLQVADGHATEETVDLAGVVPSSVELYVTPDGLVDGIGLSTDATPELVHLTRADGGLGAESTGIALGAEEYALAGGPDGAAVWMHRDAGWARARPSAAGWAVDRSGIEDPNPGARDHAAGATSDGALYIAYAVDTGNFFDDMEAPFMRRLGPTASEFESSVKVGSNTDDYLTALTLDSRGRGIVVRYCGSDVDPFGLTSTDYRCFTGGVSTDGALAQRIANEGAFARHAFARRALLQAACDSQGTLRLETQSGPDPAPAVIWPCPTVVAVEIDADGEFLPVLAVGDQLHLMRPR